MSETFLSEHWHRVARLRPRLRPHLKVHRHRYRGQAWYVIEDDLSERQHRFTAAVYVFAGLFDGVRTVDELWQDTVDRLADGAPSQDETIRVLAQLHAADLLLTDVPPVVSEMLERQERHASGEIWRRFGNPLSIKLPLLDPDRFLTRTVPLVRPCIGMTGVFLWLGIVLAALVLAGLSWAELSNDFTDRVLAKESLFAMACVYPVCKLLHELGHGYAVKRWGGAIREFGVMLLVLFPVPYVDASAAAAFRSKGCRITVGAAGMMVEVFLAALAMLVWQVSEPGTLRALAYSVMVTAGVGTVLINANPLMRLDGYYILSDLIEVPNLAQRSSQYWRWLADRYMFGIGSRDATLIATGSERVWCLFYAPLSFAYRLTISFGIGVFVATHFFFIGVAIALWGLFTTLLWPVCKGIGYVLTAPALEERRLRAIAAAGLLALNVSLAVFVLPFPLRTSAEGVVWLPEGSIVRALEDGFVRPLRIGSGLPVYRGQPLFDLENIEVADAIPLAEAQVTGLEAKLASEQFDDRVEADLTRGELHFKAGDLATIRAEASRLTIRSGADGTLVIPEAAGLAGRFVRRGQVLGFVTPAGSRIIRVAVAQADVDLVRHQLRGAALMLMGQSHRIVQARMLREVPEGLQKLPSSALSDAGGGRLAADPRDQSRSLTLQRTFQFDLELLGNASIGDFGQRVLVRFDHGLEPVGFELYRRLRQMMLSKFDA